MTSGPADVRPRAIQERLLADEELEPLVVGDAQNAVRWALQRRESYDLDRGIAAHVLDRAHLIPDKVAVEDGRRCLTYRQLAMEFLALARCLQQNNGVRFGHVVGIAGERSAHVIAGMLALQYLGAVYLALPDDWPPERTRGVLAECRVGVVLCNRCTPELNEAAASLGCVLITADFQVSDAGVDRSVAAEQGGPETPAYIIYTSGSTGVPKGAVVERRGMMNHLACKVQDLQLSHSDVVAQTAPLAFDISVWQMLAPLMVGATVRILDDATSGTACSLLGAVARDGITVIELVPTVLRQLLDECRQAGNASGLSGLRWMLATGEVLPPEVAKSWRGCQQGIPLLNAYGPTECSDDVTHHVVTVQDENSTCVPIGAPVANTVLYVLSPDPSAPSSSWLASAPGEVGELFVGGIGVGRGYIGNTDRTRQVFFRDTLSGVGRLYRTGDLVQLRSDGVLEYRGRIDRQVKIRGIRIELEEIEATLRRHPAVAACAVLLSKARGQRLVARDSIEHNEQGSARQLLVAYVCLKEPIQSRALRAFLSTQIPERVVPERYVVLSALPLTQNGKTDYAALPRADSVRPEVATRYEPPVTDMERLITSVWADALQIERVGRHDRFLELGGDSLLAMQMVVQLRGKTGCMLSFTELLTAETPERLAEIMLRGASRAGAHVSDSDIGAGIARSSHSTPWPLSVYQEGIYFQWRLAPENPYYTYQGALRLLGPVDLDRLNQAWNAVLGENLQLCAGFVEEGGKPWMRPGMCRCTLDEPRDMRDIAIEDRETAFRAWAFAQAQIPFDLSSQPAFRPTLVRFSSDEYRLLVTMHEILLDGWGAIMLISRFAELYGTPGSSRPSGPGDFRRYLDWESANLRSERIAEAARYWSSELSGTQSVLTLPIDRPRARIPSYRGALVQHVLRERELQALEVTCSRAGATRFMVLLAAFGMALAYYGNCEEVTVGVPISNRDSPAQASVVAFLLNMLPLRLVPRLHTSCSSYLTHVRDKVLRAFSVSDYPFSWMLREQNQLSRAVNQTPVFQVMLNVLNYPQPPLSAAGVAFEFIELESGFTKYDCSLYAQPHGDGSLLLQLAYQTDLFDETTAARLLESVGRAICALGEQPDAHVGEADLLPGADLALLERKPA